MTTFKVRGLIDSTSCKISHLHYDEIYCEVYVKYLILLNK